MARSRAKWLSVPSGMMPSDGLGSGKRARDRADSAVAARRDHQLDAFIDCALGTRGEVGAGGQFDRAVDPCACKRRRDRLFGSSPALPPDGLSRTRARRAAAPDPATVLP